MLDTVYWGACWCELGCLLVFTGLPASVYWAACLCMLG